MSIDRIAEVIKAHLWWPERGDSTYGTCECDPGLCGREYDIDEYARHLAEKIV